MDSNFIDNWFENEYKKYAIRDKKKPLFSKFHMIQGPYELTLENMFEKFTDDGYEKIFFWEDKSKFRGEQINLIESERSFSYKGWRVIKEKDKEENIVKKNKLTELASCSETLEKGKVIITYETY
jgi:hypothetical protein